MEKQPLHDSCNDIFFTTEMMNGIIDNLDDMKIPLASRRLIELRNKLGSTLSRLREQALRIEGEYNER